MAKKIKHFSIALAVVIEEDTTKAQEEQPEATAEPNKLKRIWKIIKE